jgi:DUF4097 and DUF4098 domain-containing protein YvlB
MTGARRATAFLAVVVSVLTAWALLQAVGAPTRTERTTLDGVPEAVAVAVDQGDVRIEASTAGAQIAATARVRSVLAPGRVAAVRNDQATLTWTCRLWTNCRADVEATVPRGSALRVTTDFGDLAVSGELGAVDLETGSGEVRAEGIRGGIVSVRGRSGDVLLGILDQPRRITVDVTSGDITVRLPAGAYRVTTSARAGDVTLREVRHDPAAAAAIDLTTTAGDIVLIGE